MFPNQCVKIHCLSIGQFLHGLPSEIKEQLQQQLPYLFEYYAQNFVRNFNQKLRVRVIHEFFHQHALFLFLFLDTDINVTQEDFEQLFGESDDESGFKL